MLLGNRLRWVVAAGVLAVAVGADAQQPAPGTPPVATPGNAQLGFKRAAQLSPRQQLAEADKMIAFMESGAADIRAMLDKARAKRDVVKSLGLNDKLSRLDTIIRAAKARRTSLQGVVESLHGRGETGGTSRLHIPVRFDDRAVDVGGMASANAKAGPVDDPSGTGGGAAPAPVGAGSLPSGVSELVELGNHEYMIIVVLYTQAQQVIAEASQVIGEEAAYFGATVVELNIDPTLGPGDETALPNTDVTLVSAPPISASPSQ